MGNYVFTADALLATVRRDADDPSSRHDMGADISTAKVARGQANACHFARNDVPGSRARPC